MIKENSLTISIVLYNHNPEELEPLLKCISEIDGAVDLYLIDNSPSAELGKVYNNRSGITYIHNDANIGYGSAHNIAIKRSISTGKIYHLVLNPDVLFEKGTIEKIFSFVESDITIGLSMPKICYMDGSTQYLCKYLPSPMDLLGRRFLPRIVMKRRLDRYEFKHKDYNQIMDVPNLSGCFMFMRIEALKKVGAFDERFFMYLEDVDLVRRINREFRTVYFPGAFIYHGYSKGSYKNWALLKYHLQSAIRYFNKWGWFFDKDRKKVNRKYR